MFVKNIQKKEINLSSFEGYEFDIPAGVSWIWDMAGEHLLKNIYKVEAKSGKDKFNNPNMGGPVALTLSTQDAWLEEGKKLTQVRRYQIKEKLIPRAKLIIIAQERGIENGMIMKYLSDQNIEVTDIIEAINSLPVSESVRYPKDLEPETSSVPKLATNEV